MNNRLGPFQIHIQLHALVQFSTRCSSRYAIEKPCQIASRSAHRRPPSDKYRKWHLIIWQLTSLVHSFTRSLAAEERSGWLARNGIDVTEARRRSWPRRHTWSRLRCEWLNRVIDHALITYFFSFSSGTWVACLCRLRGFHAPVSTAGLFSGFNYGWWL